MSDRTTVGQAAAKPPRPARHPDLSRFSDPALLGLLAHVLALARARELDGELMQILGDELVEMQIEAEARKAAAGAPSMFHALPSVRAASDEVAP